jgi:hypothetical protein
MTLIQTAIDAIATRAATVAPSADAEQLAFVGTAIQRINTAPSSVPASDLDAAVVAIRDKVASIATTASSEDLANLATAIQRIANVAASMALTVNGTPTLSSVGTLNIGTGLGVSVAGSVATITVSNPVPQVQSGRLLGRTTGGTGDAENISVGSLLTLSGGVLNAVEQAPQVEQNRLLGRFSSGTGNAEAITLGTNLTITAGGVLNATGGSAAAVIFSATAPGSPTAGQMWFRTTDSRLLGFFNDGDSNQWIQVTPPIGSSGGGGGASEDAAVAHAIIMATTR